jgi:hypothetical protein
MRSPCCLCFVYPHLSTFECLNQSFFIQNFGLYYTEGTNCLLWTRNCVKMFYFDWGPPILDFVKVLTITVKYFPCIHSVTMGAFLQFLNLNLDKQNL